MTDFVIYRRAPDRITKKLGWRSGENPGSILRSGITRGLSLLVLSSAPRGFSPSTPVFPSPQKPK